MWSTVIKIIIFFTDKPSVPSTSGQAKSQKPKARAKAPRKFESGKTKSQ